MFIGLPTVWPCKTGFIVYFYSTRLIYVLIGGEGEAGTSGMVITFEVARL